MTAQANGLEAGGPSLGVTASAVNDFAEADPNLDSEAAFVIDLPPGTDPRTGALKYHPAASGDFAIHSTAGVGIRVLDANGVDVANSLNHGVSDCGGLGEVSVFALTGGEEYRIVLGPTVVTPAHLTITYMDDFTDARYPDADGDGYGAVGKPINSACVLPNTATQSGDCDDTNASVSPGAAEVCDGMDNNCNGQYDEGVEPAVYFRDADGDGFGTPNSSAFACYAPGGYVLNSSDCNDNASNTHPGAAETCDQQDNDCDGSVDSVGGVSVCTATCAPIAVTASVTYNPTRLHPADVKLATKARVTIPSEIPVTTGNAGDSLALLAFYEKTGSLTACLYQGGGVSNPKTAAQIAAGKRYRLVLCTGMKRAGDAVNADQIVLGVAGVAKSGTTTASLNFNDSNCH